MFNKKISPDQIKAFTHRFEILGLRIEDLQALLHKTKSEKRTEKIIKNILFEKKERIAIAHLFGS